MTNPNTPSKGQKIKSLRGAANAVGRNIKSGSKEVYKATAVAVNVLVNTRRVVCGIFHVVSYPVRYPYNKITGWVEKSRTERERKEEMEKRLEALAKRGRYKLRNKDVKKRVDKILGRTSDEDRDDADNEGDDRANETNQKGVELLDELIDKSGNKEGKLYENIRLYSCVVKLLHNYHHNQKGGEENTIVEKLNMNLENLHNILSAIFGSLTGAVMDKSEIIRMIREDKIDTYKILFSEGFGLDENADKQALEPKIDKFNEIMSKFGALKKFGNVYQKEGYGSREVTLGIMSVYNKVIEGEDMTKAFEQCEDMPDKFDQKKSFDVDAAEKILAGINKAPKIKPNTQEIVASKELEEELEFLTSLADKLSSKPEVYEADYKNLYFEDKPRPQVVIEINAQMPENVGIILRNMEITGGATDVLDEIADKFHGISTKAELVAKVREIYGAIKNLYPKLKESNPLWIKRKEADLLDDLSL